MLILLLALFPRLVKLFFLCKRPPFLCFFLVLFFLLFGVGFKFSLTPFWGYLSFVSYAFVCFIGSLKPFRTRLDKLFIYPLTKLSETQETS